LRIFPDLRVDPRVTVLAGSSVFALHHAQEESGDHGLQAKKRHAVSCGIAVRSSGRFETTPM
jgi:hypothetical protein